MGVAGVLAIWLTVPPAHQENPSLAPVAGAADNSVSGSALLGARGPVIPSLRSGKKVKPIPPVSQPVSVEAGLRSQKKPRKTRTVKKSQPRSPGKPRRMAAAVQPDVPKKISNRQKLKAVIEMPEPFLKVGASGKTGVKRKTHKPPAVTQLASAESPERSEKKPANEMSSRARKSPPVPRKSRKGPAVSSNQQLEEAAVKSLRKSRLDKEDDGKGRINIVMLNDEATRSEIEAERLRRRKDLESSQRYFKAGMHHHQKKEYRLALDYYQKALTLNPGNARIYNNRSLIYREMGHRNRAVRELLRAIQIRPDYVKAYNNIGLIYYADGNFTSAAANFQKAIRINPKNLESYNNLAIIYKKQRRFGLAKRLYQKVIKLDPRQPEAYYNLALLLEEEGHMKSAARYYRHFMKIAAGTRPELVARIRERLKQLP